MKGGLGFLTLILAMAALKAALVVIVAAIGLALVVSLIIRPRETILLIVAVGLFSLAHAYPVAFAIAVAMILVGWAVARGRHLGNSKPHLVDHCRPDPHLSDGDLPR